MNARIKRLLREEDGLTLSEMLVTMMLMTIVLFALYNIFDASIRVFSFGNDKVEAVENARRGLEKMELELRDAYPRDKAGGDATLLAAWTPTRVTFGNELTGNREIRCPSPPPNPPSRCEIISYDVYKPGDSSTYALGRANSSGGVRQPVVEYVGYTNCTDTGLSFEYFARDGSRTNPSSPGAYTEADIAKVRVELEVEIDRGALGRRTQTLTTDVALRNRDG
jgi:Tfp pilus assembly protein PilX